MLLEESEENESTTADYSTTTESTQSIIEEIQREARSKWGDEALNAGGARREWLVVNANNGTVS